MKKLNKGVDYDLSHIQARVIAGIEKPIVTMADLHRFLAQWWCRRYNKPYKCTELENYTTEELLVEFYSIRYHDNPELMKEDKAKDKEQTDDDENWLKKVAGEGYLSPEEQKEALKEAQHEMDSLPSEFMDEDFSTKFDE